MELGYEGKVRLPDFVRRLGEIGYTGAFIIEREISGPQQQKDILMAIGFNYFSLAEKKEGHGLLRKVEEIGKPKDA